jgi:hypothetical protein
MCEFLSAIVTRDGAVLCEPLLDSHSDLIALFKLREGEAGNNFVRVEFLPRPDRDGKLDYSDVDSYELRMDETRIPSWWAEYAQLVTKYLRDRVKNMIIDEERAIVAGSAWILGPRAKVERLHMCRIIWASQGAVIRDAGSATINYAGHSTINDAGYATIRNAGYATIKYACAATIKYAGYAKINDAGHSTINHASSATIHNAGYAKISNAGSAKIDHAGYATINYAGYATIDHAGAATIRDAGSATVGGVRHVAGRPVRARSMQ